MKYIIIALRMRSRCMAGPTKKKITVTIKG